MIETLIGRAHGAGAGNELAAVDIDQSCPARSGDPRNGGQAAASRLAAGGV